MHGKDSKQFDYHVALSFAGQDRTYVERVALRLKDFYARRVFYDRFEEVNLLGEDLYVKLREVFAKRSFLCAIFVSKDYAEKEWTRHELRSAFEAALSRKGTYILPFRFDDTEIEGLRGTLGYIDLKTRPPEEIADLIQEKLLMLISRPIDIRVKKAEVSRASGESFVGIFFECDLSASIDGKVLIRRLYPLVSVETWLKGVETVELNGIQLERESTTMYFRPFEVDDRGVELRVRSSYDIIPDTDLHRGFALKLSFECNDETFEESFALAYNYLGDI